MSEFELDVSELTKLSDDLVASADDMVGKAKPVVARGALNVKRTMQSDMAESQHFGQVAHTISYDTRSGRDWVESEVGPVTAGRTVGDLAHLAYFGGARGGGGTVRDPQNALDEEAPNFEKAIADALLGDVL